MLRSLLQASIRTLHELTRENSGACAVILPLCQVWEHPFQACAIDSDCVKPDGQNSVISFVISK